MKQEIKVVALALAMVLIFLSGVIVGKTTGEIKISLPENSTLINNEVNAGGTGSAPVNGGATNTGNTGNSGASTDANTGNSGSTDANTGNSGSTDANTGNSGSTDANTGNSGSTSTGIPSTKADIAAAYNKAINDMRAYTGKLTLKKHDIIQVGLPEGAASKILNPIIENLTKTEPAEWTFENGVDVTDPNRKLIEKTIPWGRPATVSEASLTNATCTANADGGYTMVLTFIAEDSIFDGTKNTSEPTQHMTAMDPLNLGSLDLGPVKITNATLHYPGATMTATVDGQGRLVKLVQNLPLNGEGTGKAGLPLTLELSGSMDGNYEFIYA